MHAAINFDTKSLLFNMLFIQICVCVFVWFNLSEACFAGFLSSKRHRYTQLDLYAHMLSIRALFTVDRNVINV